MNQLYVMNTHFERNGPFVELFTSLSVRNNIKEIHTCICLGNTPQIIWA